MSYILDALKKAEMERGRTEVPTIETVHDIQVKKKTGVWITAGCGALCLIAAVWLFFSASPERSVSEVPAPVVINQGSAIEDFPEERVSIVRSSVPVVSNDLIMNLSVPETADVPDVAESETSPRIVTAESEISGSAVPEAKLQIALAQPVNSKPDVKTPPPVASTSGGSIRKTQTANDVSLVSASAAATPTAIRNGASKVSGTPPSLNEIAASMNVSVHIYSAEPEERLVFINKKQYKEGSFLEQDCIIESITPDGLVLKRGEETVVYRLEGS